MHTYDELLFVVHLHVLVEFLFAVVRLAVQEDNQRIFYRTIYAGWRNESTRKKKLQLAMINFSSTSMLTSHK